MGLSREEPTMTADQPTKAAAFKELHNRDGAFIIPNPWDVGSARILESLEQYPIRLNRQGSI